MFPEASAASLAYSTATSEQRAASLVYTSAPISLQNASVIGAPPIMMRTLSRRPAALNASTTSRITGMVVVRSAEQQTILQFWSRAASTNFSGGTSVPRSTTSSPLDSSIIFTRFLPTSCRSPLTVPMQALPEAFTPAAARTGLSISAPLFIARAATSTSGTNASPFLNLSPTTAMPAISPSLRILFGSMPSSSAC